MIQIKENTIIITINHPCPEEAIKELQQGIIAVLQYQYVNPEEIGKPTEEQNNSNYILLELLKAILNEDNKKE